MREFGSTVIVSGGRGELAGELRQQRVERAAIERRMAPRRGMREAKVRDRGVHENSSVPGLGLFDRLSA
jgi:hypothetical protein